MFVRDVMTPNPVVAYPEMGLTEALEFMSEKNVRRLPVIKARKLVGIITKSDIFAALGGFSERRTVRIKTKVGDAMAKDPVTISPDDTIENAAVIMHDRKVSGLPVMNGEELAGILTETDIFKTFVRMMGITEGGARLAFTLDSPDQLLDQVKKRTMNMVIRSLVTFHDPKADKWQVIVRIRGRAHA